jgi:hypothetical protein
MVDWTGLDGRMMGIDWSWSLKPVLECKERERIGEE